MKRTLIKEKQLERITIPKKLTNSLKKLSQDIANKASYTLEESVELIQIESLKGGLIDVKRKLYTFTFFPSENNQNTMWQFELNSRQIKEVATGTTKTLDFWACIQNKCQSKFMDKNSTCIVHDYFDDGIPDPHAKS